jgi:hypothetical protein
MSLTRRAFLQGAMSSACALPCWASLKRASGRLHIDTVIFDARRYQGLAFAETARSLGASTRVFHRESFDPRYQELFRRSKLRKEALAGLTDFPSLFLLQAMAADVGLRTILRIHHQGEVTQVHESFGAETHCALCDRRLAGAGAHWAAAAAHLVLSLPAEVVHEDNLRDANLGVIASRSLVTWVMA